MSKHNRDSAEMDKRWSVQEEEKKSKHNGVVQSRPAVRVEYPREGDVIAQPSYTFHITTATNADSVEVSIDQGEWIPCRESLGAWWHDWSGFEKGNHELVARTHMGSGISTNSVIRKFSVD